MTGQAAGDSHSHSPQSLRSRLERIDRLLLVRLRSLGDSILTLPLVDALHGWRPDLKLDLVIERAFAPVFDGYPGVHETLILRDSASSGAAGWSKARMLFEILRRRYPAVLNLHGGSTSALLTFASGASLRIGQGSYRYARAYNIHLPPSSEIWGKTDLHTADHQLSLIRWLDLPIPAEPRYALTVRPEARNRIRGRLREAGIAPGRYVNLHPSARLLTKQWPEERFARLADSLASESGLPVIFTAGQNETQILVNIGQSATQKHIYWADLGLADLFALIEGCQLFIANDSGPTHAAAALKKPVVVIWGSSNWVAWRPWGTDYELIRSELPCMPCPGYTCTAYGEPRCVLGIPVDLVLEACRRMLNRKP